MKKVCFGPLFAVMILGLVFTGITQADPSGVDADDPPYVEYVKQQLKKAHTIKASAEKVTRKKPELLKKYGALTKRKQGRTLITLANAPSPKDKNMLKPLHDIVNPMSVADQLSGLNALQAQLALASAQQQVEFTTMVHKMNVNLAQGAYEALTPDVIQDLQDQVEEAISDLTSSTVDEVEDFLNDIGDVFGW